MIKIRLTYFINQVLKSKEYDTFTVQIKLFFENDVVKAKMIHLKASADITVYIKYRYCLMKGSNIINLKLDRYVNNLFKTFLALL